MSLELDLLELYESSIEEGLDIPAKALNPKEAKIGQVRELLSIPIERFVVLAREGELFIVAPMTSYLRLLPSGTPVYKLRSQGLRLGIVPSWGYLRREFIENYSHVLGKVSEEEVERIKQYVKNANIESIGWTKRRFIRLNSKRWAKWTMASLLAHADVAEQEAVVIRLTPEIESRMDAYRTYTLAAENRYFRGENFLAVLLDKGLRLYLAKEFLGKRAKVSVGDITLFEGELEDTRLDIEGNFSGINPEEVLKVVEL